eukprot:scaffold92529_cov14-Tisochrysis_lutea.AAC.2
MKVLKFISQCKLVHKCFGFPVNHSIKHTYTITHLIGPLQGASRIRVGRTTLGTLDWQSTSAQKHLEKECGHDLTSKHKKRTEEKGMTCSRLENVQTTLIETPTLAMPSGPPSTSLSSFANKLNKTTTHAAVSHATLDMGGRCLSQPLQASACKLGAPL